MLRSSSIDPLLERSRIERSLIPVATHIGIGFSALPDPVQAAKEAAAQAKNQLNITSAHFVLLFTSIHYAVPEVLTTITKILQPQRIVGCSTAGVILSDTILTHGIGLLAIHSTDLHFRHVIETDIEGKDMRTMGFQLARDLTADYKLSNRQLFLTLADRGLADGSAFVHGTQEVLGNSIPIVGAISSDDFNFKKTIQYSDQQILSNAAVGILIGGQINVAIGSKHGWKPLGKPRFVDKVEGHIIKTIDGKPAAHIYESYFGEETKNLRETHLGSMAILYPMGVYLEEKRYYLLRNAIDILEDGSIVCQGEIPQGAEVHLMIGSKDACKQAALEAAHEVRDALFGRQAKLILIFESMTRYKLLGRSAIQEIQIIKDVLGHTTPMIGMYSAGEIAPFQTPNNQRNTHLQNESIVIVALS